MKKTIFQWAVRVSALLLVFAALRCGEEQPERTSLLLTIESRVDVSRIDIDVRNIGYQNATISKEMGDRDLRDEPLVLLILASSIIQDEFLVHVSGYQSGELVAAGAAIYEFEENRQQEQTLVLIGEFNDADGDGFEACNDSDMCDCNDQNPTINPFTIENCEDFLDNNCSGLPINEGCPCNQDEFCTPLPEQFRDLAGIGMCYFGTLVCVDGALGTTCNGGTFNPNGEIPNNLLDDNCNGVVDEDSPCTPGQRRRCFLGWVEPFPGEPGADYPPEIQFAFAYDVAGVRCETGEQVCGATGSWENACNGEVRPQRPSPPEIGWVELPSNPSEGVCAQCDGLDNDCNGQFDEEPWFDGDRDGFTQCGTNIDTGGDPLNPDDKIIGMHPDFVDCDDSRADVNPGMIEICGNTVDEDCRCDHGDPTTQIGEPYLLPPDPSNCTRPAPTCPSTAAYLDCGRLPRSDASPTGVCSDGPIECTGCEPYYHGYFGINDDCYLCVEQFGYGCSDTTDMCTTQAEDCTSCDAPTPGGPTDPTLVRPVCTAAGAGCTVTTPPQWVPVVGDDPFDECPAVDCTGYYGQDGTAGSGITAGQCFEKVDQTAADVNCNGRETCETAALLCPLETLSKSAPELPPTICQQAVSGCIGTTPPNYSPQTNNNDLFNQCNDNYTCDNAGGGGGPFYFGIAGTSGNDECYLRANVTNSACDGTGACQDRAEACSTSGDPGSEDPGPGDIVTGTYARPNCRTPTGGCTGETPPTYTDVTAGTDPYADCPVSTHSAAGGRDLDCYQGGDCYKDLGDNCSSDAECQPGWSCVDDVCCSTASCGECQRCDVTGQEGSCQPWTGNNGVNCNDDCSSCINGTCTPRSAGDFAECTVQCQACTTANGNCGAWTGEEGYNCTGVDTYCCGGSCVNPTGSSSEYNGPCGSGDCTGGTWGCSGGTTARCSSYNNPCDYCSGDRWYDAVCTSDNGATCNTGTQNDCGVCTSCRDNGATTQCVATGGANSYPAYTDDSTNPNQCTGADSCDGNGACKLDLAQTCIADPDCVSNYCTDNRCCTTNTCGMCQRCDQGGGVCQGIVADEGVSCTGACTFCNGANNCQNRPAGAFDECASSPACRACTTAGGSCGAWTGSAGTSCNAATNFCCAGTCVDPVGNPSEYGGGCGSGDCSGGTWGCSGATARCSSYNDPCDYCSGDTRYDAVCTTDNGASCSTGTSTGCGACTSCRDNGTTTACVATGGINSYTQYTDDVTSPNTCSGVNTCDGSGNCELDLGETCSAGSQCASGNCVDLVCCSSSSCGQCESCSAGGGFCTGISGDEGNSCTGPCTYCNSGTCANRAAGAYDECPSGICQGCTAAGAAGSCGNISGASGSNCQSTSTYCCAGACVDPTGSPSEYGGACGTGDCVGGNWGCSGSAARCSSWGSACDYCSGDRWYDATCTSNDGAACATGSANDCGACTSCRDNGTTTSCVASGGATNYPANSTDTNDPNQCRDGVGGCGATDCRCDGSGNCDKAIGEVCAGDGECGSGLCVDLRCCSTTCGECEQCDVPGQEGTCQNITAATGRSCNTATSFCCDGTCVNAGGEYNAACGAGDCSGTWTCNGTVQECTSLNDPCDYCSGDTEYDATCTANFGATCGAGTPSECGACELCVDGGATTSCSGGLALGTFDTTGANQCTGSTGCSGSVCTCDAGNGACLLGADESCGDDNQCASNNCQNGTNVCVGP